MTNIFENFKFEPDGAITLADALCSFLKDEIAFGRIKGGEKLPTISEISAATGLSFGQARGVTERLACEGYVHSRPHSGTIVLARGRNLLRGRVLVAYPEVDICRYYPTQLFDTINRRLTKASYAVSVTTFPVVAHGSVAQLKSELHRANNLVIAMRATPKVQRCLAESGVRRIYAYGDQPTVDEKSPWVEFNFKDALAQFAAHCESMGVRHVMQVRFEDNESYDAAPALASMGIKSSYLNISRNDVPGSGRFADVVHYTCEMFENMPRNRIPELLLFWDVHVVQGALMAFLSRGIRVPEDVKIVSLSETGFSPVYIKPVTRFEADPVYAGEKISDFALAVLAKGRVPNPPQITPRYIFGATFPFEMGDGHM